MKRALVFVAVLAAIVLGSSIILSVSNNWCTTRAADLSSVSLSVKCLNGVEKEGIKVLVLDVPYGPIGAGWEVDFEADGKMIDTATSNYWNNPYNAPSEPPNLVKVLGNQLASNRVIEMQWDASKCWYRVDENPKGPFCVSSDSAILIDVYANSIGKEFSGVAWQAGDYVYATYWTADHNWVVRLLTPFSGESSDIIIQDSGDSGDNTVSRGTPPEVFDFVGDPADPNSMAIFSWGHKIIQCFHRPPAKQAYCQRG